MPRIIISSPDGRRGVLELTRPVITIGRGTANDLVLNDASVSRFHAVIKVHDHTVSIADRGSTNGIIRNGEKIDEESELQNGDVIQVGQYALRLEKLEEKDIQIRRAEWPSTLDHIMRGRTGQVPLPRSGQALESPAELAARVRKLERENYLLTVLYEAGKALNSKLSMDDLSRQVIALTAMIEGVERGFVMLFDESGEPMQQSEVVYRDPAHSGNQSQIMLSHSVLELIRKERQAILIDDLSADERFSGSESLRISGLRSAMCAPLMGAERLFGVVYVDNMDKPGAFTQEELNVFSVVAAQAGAAIDNAAAHQKISQQVEQRLALERFLAPEVAEMIAANPQIRLGGVNQRVSVMFADIRGFTQFSEHTEPARVVEVLNEYFTRVTDVILDHDGMIDKYIGDAVMAVFGVPIAKEDDAGNAVRSAIHIQRLVAEMNRDAAARGWPELAVGIGINTGVVTAGNIGSPRRLDYTVVGDAVNLASRLMDNASGGQILISQPTAQDLGPDFKLTRLRVRRVRGRSEPVQVFSVDWQEARTHGRKKKRLGRGALADS
ncbi:MAG TPA: adenylate/guanylate cyclase domain-containing protein [Candidatus Angelobacter sp.]|nr:adenylate/guanylate cyclase domain-containing protein [Candidatus Angelobacter sp.]